MTPRLDRLFSRAGLAEWSEFKGEPAWMREVRLAAWDRWDRLSLQSGPRDLEAQGLRPVTPPPTRSVPAHEWPPYLQHTMEERGDEDGLLIQRDCTVLSRSVSKEQSRRGVLFIDLDTAVRSVPDLARRLFGRLLRTDDVWGALHAAFWNGGSLLYVPAHVETDLPFHACYWMSSAGTALFPHTLIMAERGSRVYMVDESLSPMDLRPGLFNAATEVEAADGAEVHYFNLRHLGSGVRHRASLGTDTRGTGRIQAFWNESDGQIRMDRMTRDGRMTVSASSEPPVDDVRTLEAQRPSLTRAEAAEQAVAAAFEPCLKLIPQAAMREKIRHYVVGRVTGERRPITLERAAELHPEVRV